VPIGPAARRDATKPGQDSGEATAAGRSAPDKETGGAVLEEAAQAKKEELSLLLDHAQRSALASNTTIYYRRDDQNGRMYLHVMDKRTGEELYRIPKDFLPALDPDPGDTHQVDVEI
jgi:uncharacterized FlaG/YvyC family protein